MGSSSNSRRTRRSSRKVDSVGATPDPELTELPPTISVEHAAKLLGLSRSSAYRAAASGELPTLVFGRRRFVPTARLLEMLGFPVEEPR